MGKWPLNLGRGAVVGAKFRGEGTCQEVVSKYLENSKIPKFVIIFLGLFGLVWGEYPIYTLQRRGTFYATIALESGGMLIGMCWIIWDLEVVWYLSCFCFIFHSSFLCLLTLDKESNSRDKSLSLQDCWGVCRSWQEVYFGCSRVLCIRRD